MIPVLMLLFCSVVQAVEVILCGGVALKSWEHFRGESAHDNWWANFVRASTVQMDMTRRKFPDKKIVWIVFRPSYETRGREDGKDYVDMIRQQAAKRNVQLVFTDTGDRTFEAINAAGRGSDKITSFYYFGHSNAHAFMLEYSNDMIGASTQWMHENDIATKLQKTSFAPNARCRSFGCYTGNSMSATWAKAMGFPLWGNTEATRYHPVSNGCLPMGNGRWVK
ncbi:MAG: hypothetical protein Q4F35_01785 [Akkermansia sp.]|nr:hypothetical protein [Akkermansia sp.]